MGDRGARSRHRSPDEARRRSVLADYDADPSAALTAALRDRRSTCPTRRGRMLVAARRIRRRLGDGVCWSATSSASTQLAAELNERRALDASASTVPITGWASTTRRSKPASVGRKPLRSGHSSCTTSNGAPRYHATAGREQRAPLVEVDRGEHAAQVVVEQTRSARRRAGSRCRRAACRRPGRTARAPPTGVSPNTTTSGKSNASGNPIV